MPLFYKIASFVLLINIFLASTGVVVVKHRCKMRGERVFLFSKPTDTCCPKSSNKSSETCFQATACCLEQVQIHKITTDFQVDFQNLVLASPPQVLVALSESKPFFLPYAPIKFPHFPNPPPLPTGKELLPFLATFLI